LGGQIAGNVQERLLALDAIQEANVELVWDPPWHQSMISPQGRKTLGLESV
jgi:metal-sulfur cluster biosynthetic enzyme